MLRKWLKEKVFQRIKKPQQQNDGFLWKWPPFASWGGFLILSNMQHHHLHQKLIWSHSSVALQEHLELYDHLDHWCLTIFITRWCLTTLVGFLLLVFSSSLPVLSRSSAVLGETTNSNWHFLKSKHLPFRFPIVITILFSLMIFGCFYFLWLSFG